MLGQGGPQFPFQQYLQSKQASMPGTIAGQALGQIDLQSIIGAYQKQNAQDVLAKALEAMRTGKVPTAGINGAGVPPQYSQTATAGVDGSMMNMPPVQSSSTDQSPNIMKAMLTLNPELGQKMLMDSIDPTKVATLAHIKAETDKNAAETASLPELRRSIIAKNNAEAARALREKAAITPKLEQGDAIFIKNINDKIAKNQPFTDAEIQRAKQSWGVTLANESKLGGLYHNPTATGVSGLTAEARNARKALGF